MLGSLGYWAFDNMVLWACFHAFGVSPALTVVLMGYLIGQLGGLLPIPGGLGGVEGGLVGTLVVYGVSVRDAVAAVLAYRVIQFWIPLLLVAAGLREPAARPQPARAAGPVRSGDFHLSTQRGVERRRLLPIPKWGLTGHLDSGYTYRVSSHEVPDPGHARDVTGPRL